MAGNRSDGYPVIEFVSSAQVQKEAIAGDDKKKLTPAADGKKSGFLEKGLLVEK